MSIPRIEKYRPKILEDMILDHDIYEKIVRIVKSKTLPNLLIVGNSGVGKTTLILIIKHLFFKSHIDQGILELNASDERGIKTVQDSIRSFCKKKVDFGDNTKNYSKHKIVIIDEADNMTSKAQYLINIVMEEFYNNTRFILTCNRSYDIVEAIQSKCNIIKLGYLDKNSILDRLEIICKNENIKYDINGLSVLANDCNGDVRIAINNLQLIANNKNEVQLSYINIFFDKKIYSEINNIFHLCITKKFIDALIKIHNIKNDGYSLTDIIHSMVNILKDNNYNEIDENIKIQFLDIMSTTLYTIYKGIESNIQLTACISEMCKICQTDMS